MPEPDSLRRPFQPLGEYKIPARPTTETFRRLIARIRSVLVRETDQPFIAEDRLKHTDDSRLDRVVGEPECGPLMDELDASLRDWLSTPAPTHKVVVLPPGDRDDVIETWARAHGHRVIEPPARTALEAREGTDVHLGDGAALIVIPRLEAWFLRTRNGLHLIRALLQTLDAYEGRCLVGCNSWAWAYLQRAVDAHFLLPDAITFQAFDAPRLHAWFADLIQRRGAQAPVLRLPKSGADVLDYTGNEGAGEAFFTELAAASLGIPWVAWRLWRSSLRTRLPQEDPSASDSSDPAQSDAPQSDAPQSDAPQSDAPQSDASQSDAPQSDAARLEAIGDRQTLWVGALDEYTLPGSLDQTGLLILHALLLHGALSVDELRVMLPVVGEPSVIHALLGAGLIERADGALRCVSVAYPAIRAGLLAAGYPKDRM